MRINFVVVDKTNKVGNQGIVVLKWLYAPRLCYFTSSTATISPFVRLQYECEYFTKFRCRINSIWDVPMHIEYNKLYRI